MDFIFQSSLIKPSSMPVQSIHRLNPFALQHGSNLWIHEKIQQIIFYAESRFWTILPNISNANQECLTWTQNLLQWELVCLAFGLSNLADILQSFLSYHT
jgi:hypothetical protein